MNDIANSIQKLIEAEKNFKKALTDMPSNITKAIIKLQEKTNIEYYEALSLIGEIYDVLNGKTQTETTKKSTGGRVNPQDINEIKRRIEIQKGDKKECYKAALELLNQEGEWVTKQKLRSLGIDTKALSNQKRMNACLPVGYVIQSNNRGYRTHNLKKILSK